MSECSALNPSCWLAWIRDELKAFGVWVWDGVLGGVASVLQAIPVPDFFANIGVQTMPSGISYFASAFELPLGMGIIVSAYTVRFLIRRIPVIG